MSSGESLDCRACSVLRRYLLPRCKAGEVREIASCSALGGAAADAAQSTAALARQHPTAGSSSGLLRSVAVGCAERGPQAGEGHESWAGNSCTRVCQHW